MALEEGMRSQDRPSSSDDQDDAPLDHDDAPPDHDDAPSDHERKTLRIERIARHDGPSEGRVSACHVECKSLDHWSGSRKR